MFFPFSNIQFHTMRSEIFGDVLHGYFEPKCQLTSRIHANAPKTLNSFFRRPMRLKGLVEHPMTKLPLKKWRGV